jgi:1-deoxy-D-xylulose-5-phosphate synthase
VDAVVAFAARAARTDGVTPMTHMPDPRAAAATWEGLPASPAALRRLPRSSLPEVADQLRRFITDSVLRNGGHFAAGLGVVELTVALHYLFDTPHDLLVWDIGHQCYPHKALTGRAGRLDTIRQRHGLSGFLQREESDFDTFGAGHSSTSISAALGMALAEARNASPRDVVAVIGDGALSAGMAYEALNHAGELRADLLVILNDNGMSISPSVGALNATLQGQREGTTDAAQPAGFFRALGFDYAGPVDGNDLPALLAALDQARARRGPRLLHVLTRKGQGFAPAEADPVKYHAVAPAPAAQPTGDAPASVSYGRIFGDWLCEEAERNPRVVAITPAMREGSALVRFAERFPERYFDTGIAEQHSVTLAAGLACQGMRPVVAIYSTFLQRAYDQLIHDVCVQKLPVVFALDRAGVVGPDGATHNGSFDLSFLRCIPGMTVMVPADGEELRHALQTAIRMDGPVAVRYPRADTAAAALQCPSRVLPPGAAQLRRVGHTVAILNFGTLLPAALAAAEALDATLVNMRYAKPIDESMVLRMARHHDLLVSLEDNAVAGGAGCAVAQCLLERAAPCALLQLGLPDAFLPHGPRAQILREAGLDAEGVFASVRARLASLAAQPERTRSAARRRAALSATAIGALY